MQFHLFLCVGLEHYEYLDLAYCRFYNSRTHESAFLTYDEKLHVW